MMSFRVVASGLFILPHPSQNFFSFFSFLFFLLFFLFVFSRSLLTTYTGAKIKRKRRKEACRFQCFGVLGWMCTSNLYVHTRTLRPKSYFAKRKEGLLFFQVNWGYVLFSFQS